MAAEVTVVEVAAAIAPGCVPEPLAKRRIGVLGGVAVLGADEALLVFTCRPTESIEVDLYLFPHPVDVAKRCWEWILGHSVSVWTRDGVVGGQLFSGWVPSERKHKLCWSEWDDTLLCVAYSVDRQALYEWWQHGGRSRAAAGT